MGQQLIVNPASMASQRRPSLGDSTNRDRASSLGRAKVGDPAAPDPAAASLHPQLAGAGLTRTSEGYQLADTFLFRQQLDRAMRRQDAKDDLIQSLSNSFEEEGGLRQMLVPMRSPSAGGSGNEGVKDSVVRMLLHVDSLQTDVAKLLFEQLPQVQDVMETDGSMPLTRLILSQFRWLEHVVDGDALIEAFNEALEVSAAPAAAALPCPAIHPDESNARPARWLAC